MKTDKKEQGNDELISEIFNNTKEIFDNVALTIIEKQKLKQKKIKKLLVETKQNINNYFRENEIFAKEVQLMWKKSIRGEIDDTIELFKVCLSTLENATADKYLIDELWDWIPSLMEKYKLYIYYKEISFNGKRPKWERKFIEAFEVLNLYIAYNILEISSFIFQCLKGTIIFTRKIKGMSTAGEFDVSNELDDVRDDVSEESESESTDNPTEGENEDEEWI
jgi:hypothetical protein